MKKIIVAGAGHGGITAAILLAENGCDVTVIEKKPENGIGYDWRDCIYSKDFERAGIPFLPVEKLKKFYRPAYINHAKTVKLSPESETSENLFMAERRDILSHLIAVARSAGVKFVFEKEIIAPLTDGTAVIGVYTADGEEHFADMVIDAAGMDSPVRKRLPDRFGIISGIKEKEVFTVYRAYYEKTAEKFTDPRNIIYFNHCGKCGMDWAVTEDESIDVLIGAFGELTENDIGLAEDDFLDEIPYMSRRILRGGSVARIPLRRTLPRIVCGGYAAVGDSACMTDPLSGSGIGSSIFAGSLLAQTLIDSGFDTSVRALWKYQYNYFKRRAETYMDEDLIRNALREMTAEEIDFLFEKGIIGRKELFGSASPKKEELKKAALALCPSALAKLSKAIAGMAVKSKVFAMMPEEYDEEKIRAWQKKYENL